MRHRLRRSPAGFTAGPARSIAPQPHLTGPARSWRRSEVRRARPGSSPPHPGWVPAQLVCWIVRPTLITDGILLAGLDIARDMWPGSVTQCCRGAICLLERAGTRSAISPTQSVPWPGRVGAGPWPRLGRPTTGERQGTPPQVSGRAQLRRRMTGRHHRRVTAADPMAGSWLLWTPIVGGGRLICASGTAER